MSDDWTISASKLKAHQRCGEEFRLRYIEGHEERGPASRWIRRGNAVHEAIERLLNDGVTDPTGSMLKAAYRNNGGQDGYDLDDEFHAQVCQCLEAAARYIAGNVDAIRGVEDEVEFGTRHPTITRDFGGYMDLATGSAVVDWKTGKSKGKASNEALQGAVYMAGYADLYGEAPEEIVFVYLNEDGDSGDRQDHPKSTSIDPDDDLWDRLIGKARKLLADIDGDGLEADPAEDKCHFCDFEIHCTTSPVGVGNVDWESYP